MELTGEGEDRSTWSKILSHCHFVHYKSHVELAWDCTWTSAVRGWWINCVSHGTVFLEVTLCSLGGRSHHFRWHCHEDGDICTRLYGITSQKTVILSYLQ